MGPHRADIRRGDGLVIELQHSSIDPATIQEREAYYGNMIWLVDLRDRQHHFYIRPGAEGGPRPFDWQHPRKSWTFAKKPIVIDLGNRLLHVLSLSEDGTMGTGQIWSIARFLERNGLSPMTTAEAAAPVRYEIRHSNSEVQDVLSSCALPRSAFEYVRSAVARRLAVGVGKHQWWVAPRVTADGIKWAALFTEIASHDYHEIDLTVVARSGRRQTMRHRLAWLTRSGERLVLRYRGGHEVALYQPAKVAPSPTTEPAVQIYRPRVCREIFFAGGDRRWALPMLRGPLPRIRGPICPPPKAAHLTRELKGVGAGWSLVERSDGYVGVHRRRQYEAQDFRDWLANRPRKPLVAAAPHIVFADAVDAERWAQGHPS